MRRGIFLSWPQKITFGIPNPYNPEQGIVFTNRRQYVWWMVQRPRAAWKHLLWRIRRLFQWLVIRVVRIVTTGRRERAAEDAIVAEFFEEHRRVSKAWSEARRRGDPQALKYEKELMDSIASREHCDAGFFFEMQKKWYDEAYQYSPK